MHRISQQAVVVDVLEHGKGTHRNMRNSSSISESPGKSGWRFTISAKMHPTRKNRNVSQSCMERILAAN